MLTTAGATSLLSESQLDKWVDAGAGPLVLVRRAAGWSVRLNSELYSYPYTLYSLPYRIAASASGDTVYRIAILIQCIVYRIGYVAGG